jgi:hypothetical protein
MRKFQRSPRRTNKDHAATTDVVSQLECAIRRPQATLIGALVGGVVPWFARTLAHEELPAAWSAGQRAVALLMIAVVLGCACFSALTVYKFGRATFNDHRKALGFVLAIEGVMLVSQGATSAVALAVLVAINALSNGSAIALARDAACKKREAAARAAATRRSRGAGVPKVRAPHVQFPAIDDQVPTAVPQRPRTSAPVRWTPAATDDVIDVKFVSARRLLA